MINKIISHYKILEKIGEGGMGIVYKAFDTKLERTVALKLLRPETIGDPDAKKRFIREARAVSKLNHPNITTIYEVDEWHGQNFISMEFVEGLTLKEKVKSGHLPIEEVRNIAEQVAEALQEAHDHNIVHRDIKSENIMVTPKGQVKVMDFGLAKLKGMKTMTQMGTTMGTAAYMSPEQARGEEVDHRTDIWSFGVVLYEMITGQLPFKGDYEQAVIYSILNEEPKSISVVHPDLPFKFEQIVNNALSKSLEERYQNLSEILSDLNTFKIEYKTNGKFQNIDRRKTSRKKLIQKTTIPIGIMLLLILGFYLLKPLLFEKMFGSALLPIAILPFENRTGEEEYNNLSETIQELLISKLNDSRYLSVTTQERMNDIKKQLVDDDVEFNKELGFKICEFDSIDVVIVGSVSKAGNTFVTDLKVLDVDSKKLLKSATAKGKGVASILENQIDALGNQISRIVGLSERKIQANQRPITDMTTSSWEAHNYFKRGKEEWGKLYFSDAKTFIEKAIALDSTYAEAYFILASINNHLGNTEGMKTAIEKAKTYSGITTEKVGLLIEGFYVAQIEKDQEKVFSIYKQLAKKYPKDKEIHYWLGRIYKSKKFYSKAIKELNKASELDPEYSFPIMSLGYTFSEIGDYDKAIEYFKQYATLSPGDANPFASMAELYFKMGRLDDAMDKFKEALEVNPDFNTEWAIGYIHALKENYTEAKKNVHKFNTVSSLSMKAGDLLWKGLYHYWLGSLDQSINALRHAEEVYSSMGNKGGIAFTKRLKGWIYYYSGELELGSLYFKSGFNLAVKNNPANISMLNAEFNFYFGLVDLKEGRIDSAKKRLAKIRSLYPKLSSSAWFTHNYDLLHAEVLLAEAFIEKTIAICEKTLVMEIPTWYPMNFIYYNIPFIKDVFARAYKQKGDLDKAIDEYERLLTFDPASKVRFLIHPKFHYRVAKLYEKKDWKGKAIEQYKKFLEIWKDADEDLPELIDATKRLNNLTGT